MPAFRANDFEIQLPADFSDESTYAFALPARANFRPSIVVKTERLTVPVDLSSYVAHQLAKIRELLQDVSVIASGPAQHGGLAAFTSTYDWGERSRRIRQKQHYLLLDNPARIVTLTATSLCETFAEAETLFNAIFLSFKPIGH